MPTTQYIGSRYVPLFADPMEWSSAKEYEPLTIVLHEGNSFTSKQFVPVGIDIANETYWAETGNYNAQVEQYRRETAQAVAQINDWYDSAVTEYADKYGAKPFAFDTVADMQAARDLLYVGAICHTNGFHTSSDGGAAWYAISDTGDANGMDVIACGATLFANLIDVGYRVSPIMLGAKDNENATSVFKYLFGKYNFIELPINKTFIIDDYVRIGSNVDCLFNSVVKAIGSGKCSFITFIPNGNQPEYSGSHDIWIHGCGTFDGNGKIYTSANATPFRIHHAKNIIIEGIRITNWSKYHAIEIGGSYNANINNITFDSFQINGAKSSVEAIQIEVTTESGTGDATPYDNTYSKNITISNCIFEPKDGSMIQAIGIHTGADTTRMNNYENITIDSNYIKCSGNIGNYLHSFINAGISLGFNVKHGFIKNNTIIDAFSVGLYIGNYSDDVVVQNNLIENSGWTGLMVGYVDPSAQTTPRVDNIKMYENTIRGFSMRQTKQDGAGIVLAITHNCLIIKNTIVLKNAVVPIAIHCPLESFSLGSNYRVAENTYISEIGSQIFSNRLFVNNYRRLRDVSNVIYDGHLASGETISGINLHEYSELKIITGVDSLHFTEHSISYDASDFGSVALTEINLTNAPTSTAFTIYEINLTGNLDNDTLRCDSLIKRVVEQGSITPSVAEVSTYAGFAHVRRIIGIGNNGDSFIGA